LFRHSYRASYGEALLQAYHFLSPTWPAHRPAPACLATQLPSCGKWAAGRVVRGILFLTKNQNCSDRAEKRQ